MSEFALALVLGAAVLHAVWNAIIKFADDRAIALALVSAANVVAGLALVLIFPTPLAASWPYIVASILIHYFYVGFLFFSYRFGDLSQVYPISRGLAPILVALGAQRFANEVLPWPMWLGIITISFGIGVLSISGWKTTSRLPIMMAVGTGIIIATYSVIDGIGVRLSQGVFGYIGWLFIGELPVIFYVLYLRRGKWHHVPGGHLVLGFFGGFCSVFAYALVLYAKTIAPLGAVSAVRESSVIVAALIGVLLLGEPHWRQRIGAAIIVGIGILVLAFSS